MNDLTTWLSILIAVVGVSVTIYELYLIRVQNQFDYYNEFTARYREILVNLPVKSLTQQELDDEKYLSWYAAYFDLCCEQLFLHDKGHIKSYDVWQEWEEGIKEAFKNSNNQNAWTILKGYGKSYPNLDKYAQHK